MLVAQQDEVLDAVIGSVAVDVVELEVSVLTAPRDGASMPGLNGHRSAQVGWDRRTRVSVLASGHRFLSD
jgi:hypothetical protein